MGEITETLEVGELSSFPEVREFDLRFGEEEVFVRQEKRSFTLIHPALGITYLVDVTDREDPTTKDPSDKSSKPKVVGEILKDLLKKPSSLDSFAIHNKVVALVTNRLDSHQRERVYLGVQIINEENTEITERILRLADFHPGSFYVPFSSDTSLAREYVDRETGEALKEGKESEVLARLGFREVSGSVLLSEGRKPILRPPFVDFKTYLQSLESVDPRMENPDLYLAEFRYIFNRFKLRRLREAGAEVSASMSLEQIKNEEALKEIAQNSEAFWTPERRQLARTILKEFQKFISPYTKRKTALDLENLSLKIQSQKKEFIGQITRPWGIITLESPSLKKKEEFTATFPHELSHFFGKAILLEEAPGFFLTRRLGIRVSKRWRPLNEGLTTLITDEFLGRFAKKFFPLHQRPALLLRGMPYPQEVLLVRMTEAVMSERGIKDPRHLFKEAYFGGQLLPLGRALEATFEKQGGFSRYKELIDDYERASPEMKKDAYKEWEEFVLSAIPNKLKRRMIEERVRRGRILSVLTKVF